VPDNFSPAQAISFMSSIERVLVPGSADLPDCGCGSEMDLIAQEKVGNQSEAETRMYRCAKCGRELRLMVWLDAASGMAPEDQHRHGRLSSEPAVPPIFCDALSGL
jgi:hypothetical protein